MLTCFKFTDLISPVQIEIQIICVIFEIIDYSCNGRYIFCAVFKLLPASLHFMKNPSEGRVCFKRVKEGLKGLTKIQSFILSERR